MTMCFAFSLGNSALKHLQKISSLLIIVECKLSFDALKIPTVVDLHGDSKKGSIV